MMGRIFEILWTEANQNMRNDLIDAESVLGKSE